MNDPRKQISLKNPWHFFATGCGSGLSPVVPGTMGTLAAIPFFLVLSFAPLWAYILIVIAASVIGIKICQVTADDMRVHDHGSIVWDEFVGFWLTMLVVPIYGLSVWDWHWTLAGFVLFRFFDMLKPWPISWLDKHVHGGFGIMVDDVLAGIFAAIGLVLLGHWAGW